MEIDHKNVDLTNGKVDKTKLSVNQAEQRNGHHHESPRQLNGNWTNGNDKSTPCRWSGKTGSGKDSLKQLIRPMKEETLKFGGIRTKRVATCKNMATIKLPELSNLSELMRFASEESRYVATDDISLKLEGSEEVKAQVRVYVNGQGSAENKYTSVFVTLYPRDNSTRDALKVTLFVRSPKGNGNFRKSFEMAWDKNESNTKGIREFISKGGMCQFVAHDDSIMLGVKFE